MMIVEMRKPEITKKMSTPLKSTCERFRKRVENHNRQNRDRAQAVNVGAVFRMRWR